MDIGTAAVRLLVELARRGCRQKIAAWTLAVLAGTALEHGVETVCDWIEEDTGWLICPSARWWGWGGDLWGPEGSYTLPERPGLARQR